ncbi:hypothetical protein MUK42_36005 [Musa troglodytarum]|uniref:Uncharacterized protein n=1 Tax=Musa troglodytarum TaxID=320322 RepID=A0A9E7EGF3_9LILI|nr:hypothetical protein MUK42_36005 [Musa troglodytarum]
MRKNLLDLCLSKRAGTSLHAGQSHRYEKATRLVPNCGIYVNSSSVHVSHAEGARFTCFNAAFTPCCTWTRSDDTSGDGPLQSSSLEVIGTAQLKSDMELRSIDPAPTQRYITYSYCIWHLFEVAKSEMVD